MQSTAHVAKHPIHTMLVHFPIAFWLGAFVADIIAAVGGTSHEFGYYLVLAGCIGGALAAIAGFIDVLGTVLPKGSARMRRVALSHATASATALLAWFVSFLMRPAPQLMSEGAWVASSVGLLLVSIAGYLGGRLVYEFRIGVPDASSFKTTDSRATPDVGASRPDAGKRVA